MMEDFGGRLASVWSELRPTTRGLVERAFTNAQRHPPNLAILMPLTLLTMPAPITN